MTGMPVGKSVIMPNGYDMVRDNDRGTVVT
jgi:hypothetical protein